MKAVQDNYKTFKSLDLTTLCPKQREGNPCEYCYVQQGRSQGFRAKKEIDRIPYEGEILKLSKECIEELNNSGGLRLFSFGDYMEWMDEDINKILEDAQIVGLRIKAISKQDKFIERYFDKIMINFSIDLLSPVDLDKIERYKNKGVRIRTMVRNEEEVIIANQFSDILTPYHGKKLNNHYRPGEAKNAARRIAPSKTCCLTGKCKTCLVKCGAAT